MAESLISSNQYIIFTLVKETMGIPIDLVREVISLNSHTLYQIPGSPDFFKGVINLRGQVIPILDARSKLNFGLNSPPPENPKSIIVQCDKEHFGLVVDDVEEVATIEDSSIEDAPGHLAVTHKDRKIGRISGKDNDKDRFVFLLSKEFLFDDNNSKGSLIPSQFRKMLNEVSNKKTD
ncbi:MAG: chemotaxis protein CheW [Candidatus Caenarcaniphilales bacterium]|nr:chemotaxis protein CheW [Candidatus Caenarcaniphilales bacterium]